MHPQQAQRRHAKKRLASRYGMTVNRIAYKDLVARIKRPRGQREARNAWRVVVSWMNQNRYLWIVKYNEEFIPVIYDKRTECVVTVLPGDVIQYIDSRILEKAGYFQGHEKGRIDNNLMELNKKQ